MAESVVLHGVVLTAGKNQAVPLKAIDNGDGTWTLDIAATLNVGDIQIGAVEIKDHTTDDRQHVDPEGVAKTSLPNRPGFIVREFSTGGVADTEQTGPNVAVPDGHAVYIEADSGNTSDVKIGGDGETGVAGQFRTVAAGDAFPVAVRVDNLNKIAAQSAGLNQTVRLIVEAVT